MMLLSRIFLIEFGVFVAAAMGLLAWQVGRAWWGRRWRLRGEDAVLLGGTLASCGAYGLEQLQAEQGTLPRISWAWVMVFGASCAVHVGLKAVRFWKQKGDAYGRRSA